MVRSGLLLFLFFVGARLSAATYYVSTAGNNSNPGSQSLPWLTIQHAASTVAAGDIVNITNGVYAENVTLATSGTTNSRIQFNGPGAPTSFTVNGSYVTLNSMTFSNPCPSQLVVLNGSYGLVTGCEFCTPYSGTRGQTGIYMQGNYCTVTNCDWSSVACDGQGVVTAFQIGALVVNNRMHDLEDPDAWIFVWGTNVVIRGNVMTNVQNDGYNSQQVHADFIQTFAPSSSYVLTNVLVEGNTIINCSVQCFMLDSCGVTLGVCGYMGGMTIRNNLFINSLQSGFIDLPYVSVYNNTFFNWGYANHWAFCVCPAHSVWGPGDHCRIYNNVFRSDGTTSGSYITNNYGPAVDCLADYDYVPSSVGETHGIVGGTPGFVSEGTALQQWTNGVYWNTGTYFHLLTNSILRGVGTNLTLFFTTDFGGNTRRSSGAWDIGAYVYGSVSTNQFDLLAWSVWPVAPLTVQTKGSASGTNNFSFNFGDGSSSNGASTIHTYATQGTYTVTVTVTNTSGQVKVDSKSIIVTQ